MKDIELFEIICNIASPYDNIGEQLKNNVEMVEVFGENKDLDNYDLFKMIPKVTYDDWIVCLYEVDGKLYRIDEENVCEVKPICVLEYNEDFNAVTPNGDIICDEDELFEYCESDFAGETDDMRYYAYFEFVVSEEFLL